MTAAIYEAIPAILADVDAIGKTRNNQQQGYKFRGIDDVYNAIHPLLAKHKVFPTCEIISRELTERETKNGGVLFYVNIKAKYTLWASDGSNVVTEAWGEAMDSGDKASNKAMSAAYKYALFQLLCIPTEAVDSEQETHDVAPKRTDVKPKSPAKQVAEQHGMKTADELQPSKSYTVAISMIVDAVKARDVNEIARIMNVAGDAVEAGRITKSEHSGITNECTLALKKIKAAESEPVEAAA
jgi:hypothetical protein